MDSEKSTEKKIVLDKLILGKGKILDLFAELRGKVIFIVGF